MKVLLPSLLISSLWITNKRQKSVQSSKYITKVANDKIYPEKQIVYFNRLRKKSNSLSSSKNRYGSKFSQPQIIKDPGYKSNSYDADYSYGADPYSYPEDIPYQECNKGLTYNWPIITLFSHPSLDDDISLLVLVCFILSSRRQEEEDMEGQSHFGIRRASFRQIRSTLFVISSDCGRHDYDVDHIDNIDIDVNINVNNLNHIHYFNNINNVNNIDNNNNIDDNDDA